MCQARLGGLRTESGFEGVRLAGRGKGRACHLQWLLLCNCVTLMSTILRPRTQIFILSKHFAAMFVNLVIRLDFIHLS